MTATTRRFDPTALSNTLCVSFELGEGTWTLSFTADFGNPVIARTVTTRDRGGVLRAMEAMKARLGLGAEARVVRTCS